MVLLASLQLFLFSSLLVARSIVVSMSLSYTAVKINEHMVEQFCLDYKSIEYSQQQ